VIDKIKIKNCRFITTLLLLCYYADVIVTVPESNYVVVYHKGCFFKVTVVFGGDLIQPVDIQM